MRIMGLRQFTRCENKQGNLGGFTTKTLPIFFFDETKHMKICSLDNCGSTVGKSISDTVV